MESTKIKLELSQRLIIKSKIKGIKRHFYFMKEHEFVLKLNIMIDRHYSIIFYLYYIGIILVLYIGITLYFGYFLFIIFGIVIISTQVQ